MLTKLGLHILNSVTDDYENIASMRESVKVQDVVCQENEFEECLRGLINQGFVESYRYDVEKSGFVKEALTPIVDLLGLVFYITKLGREQLDQNWNQLGH